LIVSPGTYAYPFSDEYSERYLPYFRHTFNSSYIAGFFFGRQLLLFRCGTGYVMFSLGEYTYVYSSTFARNVLSLQVHRTGRITIAVLVRHFLDPRKNFALWPLGHSRKSGRVVYSFTFAIPSFRLRRTGRTHSSARSSLSQSPEEFRIVILIFNFVRTN